MHWNLNIEAYKQRAVSNRGHGFGHWVQAYCHEFATQRTQANQRTEHVWYIAPVMSSRYLIVHEEKQTVTSNYLDPAK